jgi:hypothetical protein
MDWQSNGEGGDDRAGGSVHKHEDANQHSRPVLTPESCGGLLKVGRQYTTIKTGAADATGHRKQAGHGTGGIVMADVTNSSTDQPTELLARQRALQAEAEQIRARLDLGRVLGSVGDPVVVGSAAMGLMTWRDLDITVVCPSLDKRQVLGIATELAGHQDVKALQYRNDTGRWNQEPEKYPDGLYLGLCYHPPELPEWKLDLWFVDDPARQPDLGHLRTLSERLTDDARLAILRIKTLWSARPQYGTSVRSWDIYTAVLDHGVRSTDEFDRWLTSK